MSLAVTIPGSIAIAPERSPAGGGGVEFLWPSIRPAWVSVAMLPPSLPLDRRHSPELPGQLQPLRRGQRQVDAVRAYDRTRPHAADAQDLLDHGQFLSVLQREHGVTVMVGQGVIAMGGGGIVAFLAVDLDDQIMITTNSGQSIRCNVSDISIRSRAAGGSGS